ncbi:unnamed protein product, partial [marine sediment metagenome]
LLPDYGDVRHIFEEGTKLDVEQKELMADIWGDLQFAYKFGSLIRLDEKVKAKLKSLEAKQNLDQRELFTAAEIETHKDFAANFFANLKTAVEQYVCTERNTFLVNKTRDAITFLELLTTDYDVATANPPYTDSADFGPELKEFINDNYKKPYKFHCNLYASFVKRCYDFIKEDGLVAIIHTNTLMFIKSFQSAREFLLHQTSINILVEYGLDRVNLFGPGILLDAMFYVFSKAKNSGSSLFFNINNGLQEKRKKEVCFK